MFSSETQNPSKTNYMLNDAFSAAEKLALILLEFFIQRNLTLLTCNKIKRSLKYCYVAA